MSPASGLGATSKRSRKQTGIDDQSNEYRQAVSRNHGTISNRLAAGRTDRDHRPVTADPTPNPTMSIQSNQTDQNASVPSFTHRAIRRGPSVLVLLSLFVVQPALAQDNAICDAARLPEMISGFFQITTAVGLIGLVIVWQADSLAEMFTLNREQREGLKQHKRTALKSTLILLVLGPLYRVAGTMMNLPLADCVDLAPW